MLAKKLEQLSDASVSDFVHPLVLACCEFGASDSASCLPLQQLCQGRFKLTIVNVA